MALTYLCLRHAETHTQHPGTHLILTLEGEAAVGNVHTAAGEEYMNADTAVWLHAHEHTTPRTVVPGSHPWNVVIVRLPTGADTGSAQQGWRTGGHTCAPPCTKGCTDPLSPVTPYSRPPRRPNPTPGRPPPPESGPTRAPSTARQRKTAISNHQGLVHTPHDNMQKG